MPVYEDLSEADDTTREELSDLLLEDEEVICVVRNQDMIGRLLGVDETGDSWLAKLGNWNDSFWRLALTDERLIKFSPHVGRGSETYDLSAVTSVEYSTSLSISGSGFEEEFTEFIVSDMDEVAPKIRDRAANYSE